jgi:hypothetical protein
MNWYDIRNKIYKQMGEVNSIDKLMKDKLDPYIILEELPLPIQIGEKVIYVGNLNLSNEDYFFDNWAKILGNLGLQNLFLDLMSDGLKLMQYMKTHKKLRKELTNLVCKTILKQQKWYYPKNDMTYKLNKCSFGYMKNHMSKEKLIQIVFLIYTFNYDSLGKSMALIVQKMGAGAISQTYMYTWLQNLAGVNGKFLADQLPNLDWYNKEDQFPEEEEEKVNG